MIGRLEPRRHRRDGSRRGRRASIGDTLGAEVSAPCAHARARRHGRVRRPCRTPRSSFSSRSASGSPIAAVPRTQPGRRHPPRLLRGGRYRGRPRSARARRRPRPRRRRAAGSARTASRCCSCTRRTSAARWSSWNRPDGPAMRIVQSGRRARSRRPCAVVAVAVRERPSPRVGVVRPDPRSGPSALYFVVWWTFALRRAAVRRAQPGGSGRGDGRQRAGRAGRAGAAREGALDDLAATLVFVARCLAPAARWPVGGSRKQKSKAYALLQLPFGHNLGLYMRRRQSRRIGAFFLPKLGPPPLHKDRKRRLAGRTCIAGPLGFVTVWASTMTADFCRHRCAGRRLASRRSAASACLFRRHCVVCPS